LIRPPQKNHDVFNNSIFYQDGTMVICSSRHLYIIQEQTFKLKRTSYNGVWDKYDGISHIQEQMWIMMRCHIYKNKLWCYPKEHFDYILLWVLCSSPFLTLAFIGPWVISLISCGAYKSTNVYKVKTC